MGLFGDTLGSIADTVDSIGDSVSDVIFGDGGDEPTDGTSDDPSTGDSIPDTIDDTEDSINEGASDVADGADQSFAEMIDGGAQTVQGFFHAVGDGFDWVANNLITYIPTGAGDFMESLFEGIGGFFHALAGGAGAVGSLLVFLTSLSGFEGASLLVGLLVMILGIYMVISSFGLQTFDAILTTYIGFGLFMYAISNVTGGAILAFGGMALVGIALLADRMTFFIFGIPTLAIGLWMLFTVFLPGQYIASLIFVAASLIAVIYSTEYLENRLAPRVGSDEPIFVGSEQ